MANEVVKLVPILGWLLALVFAGIAVMRAPRPLPPGFVADRLLRYILVFPVGIVALWAASGHIFIPAEVAQSIGWPTSPFQFEVGAANLGIGIAGLYAAFSGWQARMAVALAVGGFLLVDGIGHIRDIAASGNLAPGNAGPILLTDILTPIVIFILLALTHRHEVEPAKC